jgi:hypothetical protein
LGPHLRDRRCCRRRGLWPQPSPLQTPHHVTAAAAAAAAASGCCRRRRRRRCRRRRSSHSISP